MSGLSLLILHVLRPHIGSMTASQMAPHGFWSKVVHNVGDRVQFGMLPTPLSLICLFPTFSSQPNIPFPHTHTQIKTLGSEVIHTQMAAAFFVCFVHFSFCCSLLAPIRLAISNTRLLPNHVHQSVLVRDSTEQF